MFCFSKSLILFLGFITLFIFGSLFSIPGYCYSLRVGWDSHVTVANEWLEKLPEKTMQEEAKLLEIAEDISPKYVWVKRMFTNIHKIQI